MTPATAGSEIRSDPLPLSRFCNASEEGIELTMVDKPIGLKFCFNELCIYKPKNNIRICNPVFCFYVYIFIDLAFITSNYFCIYFVRFEHKHILFLMSEFTCSD